MESPLLQRTAAEVLAAATFEMFPKVVLLGGSDTPSGFYYDFYFPHPINPELHHQIEEKMRQIAKEKREIRELEMAGVSAREFLKSKGHFERAELVENQGLYSILQMGSFVDLIFGSCLKNSFELANFKIFPPMELEDRQIRISGVASSSKDQLKTFLKKKTAYQSKRHEKTGELKQYWKSMEGEWVYLSEGLKARDRLISRFKENISPNAFEISCIHSSNRSLLHNKILNERNLEAVVEEFPVSLEKSSIEETGLFEPSQGLQIQITTSIKNTISFLQSIGKTLNILGFNYCVRFTPSNKKAAKGRLLTEALQNSQVLFETSEEKADLPRLDFLVEDGLGRQWSAVSIYANECIWCHIVVERNLALLLELQEFVNFIV